MDVARLSWRCGGTTPEAGVLYSKMMCYIYSDKVTRDIASAELWCIGIHDPEQLTGTDPLESMTVKMTVYNFAFS